MYEPHGKKKQPLSVLNKAVIANFLTLLIMFYLLEPWSQNVHMNNFSVYDNQEELRKSVPQDYRFIVFFSSVET